MPNDFRQPFISSVAPKPDVRPEPTSAMLLTKKLPMLFDPVRGMYYRAVLIIEGRSTNEAITTQDEFIAELSRQLKDQEKQAARADLNESFRATYRENIEILKRALLAENAALNTTQQSQSGTASFFSNFSSLFFGNTGPKQATSAAAAADSGQKQQIAPSK